MDNAVLQAAITLVGVLVSGFVGLRSGQASARAQQHVAAVNAEVALEANDTEAAKAVVQGAIALSAGIRAELDAVRADQERDRKANREQRERLVARIEHLETELDTTRRHNMELREQVEALSRQTRTPGTRSRKGDKP